MLLHLLLAVCLNKNAVICRFFKNSRKADRSLCFRSAFFFLSVFYCFGNLVNKRMQIRHQVADDTSQQYCAIIQEEKVIRQ